MKMYVVPWFTRDDIKQKKYVFPSKTAVPEEFYAIIKRGPLIHKINVCEVYNFHILPSTVDNRGDGHMTLPSTLAEASYIEHEHPEFATIGIAGKWKFDGKLQLIHEIKDYSFITETSNYFYNDYQKFLEASFISKYLSKFTDHFFTIYLSPKQSHGLWDGKQPFAIDTHTSFGNEEPIVVLTRATIKLNKAKDFWKNVPEIAQNFSTNEGFIYSIGIGEVPFLKQATISIWKNESSMKAFAYQKKQHAEVIKKTRQNKWYSEELFARFSLMGSSGKIPDSFSKLP